ncbi:PREDICTED: brassinosteroid-related acyltransferase 1 [Tarenaya hassleriana]|uniref:brassinosteroid-related acyltransferase 1 n=1 Tax=Tarenaya hassleriana TaxID=28532 RepID=UPI00053CA40C|nr:PREDICTED: brassinosteroid-related acyltransferase 1 [Tarenaya hassleriana]
MADENDAIIENSSSEMDIVRKLHVYPELQHPEKTLSLSNLDRQCPLLMYLVFFYKSDKTRNVSSESVFSNLRLGLEQTLSVWYPAAGRLCLDPKDMKLNLWCNNGGAVMVEAATRVEMSELGDLFQYNEFSETLVYKPPFNGDFPEVPLVVAQVTRFACGGYSIGIGTSHSVFDGLSAYEFLHAWASNSYIHNITNNGNSNNDNNNNNNNEDDQAMMIEPVHERGNLLTTTNPKPGTRAAAIDHLYQLIKQMMTEQMAMVNGGQNGHFEDPSSGFLIKTFEVSGEAVERMKKRAMGGDGKLPKGFSCSSFELLAAHLWKVRTRALGLRSDAMVCLQFAVDIRKRAEPPLPEYFSGNAYVLASVASTAGELLNLTIESIVHKTREAKNSVDQDYINAYVEALGQGRNDANLPPIKELTIVSDWTKMPFHKVGFIAGEPADYVSPLCPPVPQVAYFMQSPKDPKGLHVRIGLNPQNVDDFSNHFLNYNH